jgi:hypothetical protein
MTQWRFGKKEHGGSKGRVAIDIGSTVVKVASVASDGELLGQEFYPRDSDARIARQVESIVNHIAGRALARSEIASTLNNRMEACRDPALLTFFVDKTHPGWLQSLGG